MIITSPHECLVPETTFILCFNKIHCQYFIGIMVFPQSGMGEHGHVSGLWDETAAPAGSSCLHMVLHSLVVPLVDPVGPLHSHEHRPGGADTGGRIRFVPRDPTHPGRSVPCHPVLLAGQGASILR